MDAETLYRQLGRIIESAPDFSGYGPLSVEHLTWLGREHALVDASDNLIAKAEFDLASKKLQSALRHDGINSIMLTLYKVLGIAELKAPPSSRGAFIPAGNSFDAFTAITKLFQTAQRDVLIVDPYMDETALTEFGTSIVPGIQLRLLADKSTAKASLNTAAIKWRSQHESERPLAVRLASARSLHDRAVLIDGSTAWILTQSLKDFAKRSPAEIVRADDTATLKIAAYEDIWKSSEIIV